jgi:hypothetical protein
MTEQDQDAIVGKAHRELRDAKEKLAKLRARATGFGDSFSTVAHHLRDRLEYLRLDGERTDARFVEQRPQHIDREPHIPKPDTLEIKTF